LPGRLRAALAGVLQLGAAALFLGAANVSRTRCGPFVLVLWFSILPTTLLLRAGLRAFHAKGWANMAAAIVLGIASSAVLVALFRNGAMALYALPSGAVVGRRRIS
jgi:hypothetical protein